MLELKINGQTAELALGAEISVSKTNPVFDPNSVDRAFSFPFALPLSPKNKRIRKHSSRLDAALDTGIQPAQVRFGGHLMLDGEIITNSISPTAEDVAVANRPTRVLEKLGRLKINEILPPKRIIPTSATQPQWVFNLNTTFSVTYSISISVGGDLKVCFATANNAGQVDTAGQSVVDQLNTHVPGIAEYLPGVQDIKLNGWLVQENPITQFIGMTINFWLNPPLFYHQNIRGHVDDVSENPTDSHCFPLMRWQNLYQERNLTHKNAGYSLINVCIDRVTGENEIQNDDEDELLWRYTVIPCVRVPYVLKVIAEQAGGYEWAGEIWDDPDFQRLIIVSNLTLDKVYTSQWDDLNYYKLNGYAVDENGFLNLNAHVPAMSAADFIERICDTFGLFVRADESNLYFVKKKPLLDKPPYPLTNRVSAEPVIEPNKVRGWQLFSQPNEIDEFSAPGQIVPIVTGEGEHQVATVTTFRFADAPMPFGGAGMAKVPHTKQPGKCPVFENSATKSTLPLTMLFDYGEQQTQYGNLYVFASHDGLSRDGGTLGEYSLDPSGDTGLYATFHKGLIEYSNSKKVKITGYLHPGEVSKLMEMDTARVAFYHPNGSVVCALKSIQTSANTVGIAPVQLELLII